MRKKILPVIGCLVLVYWMVLVYIVLHEGGHALAAMLSGARIDRFDINFLTSRPHVSYVGHLTAGQRAFVSAAGPLFPVLVWFGFIGTIPGHAKPPWAYVRIISAFGIIGSLLPGVVIPVLYQLGRPVPGEDWTRFVAYSSLNGYAVGGLVLLLVALVLKVALPRIPDLRRLRADLQAMEVDWTRASVVIPALILTLLSILPLTSYVPHLGGEVSRVAVASSSGPMRLAAFEIDEEREPAMVRLLYSFSAIEADFRVVIASPTGTVLWEQGHWAGRQVQAQSQEDVALAAGQYEILVLGAVEDLDMELRYWIRP